MTGPGRPPLDRAELDPILQAVLRLAAASGSRSITFKQIAQEAKVSVGRLQHHFGTRDGLVREAFERHLLSISTRLEALGSAPGSTVERMARLADEVADHRSWQRATLWVDLLSRSVDSPDYLAAVQRINGAWNAVFVELITEGVARGEFTVEGTVEEAAAFIVAVADGLTVIIVTAGEDRLHQQRGLRRATLARAIESVLGVRV